MNLLETFSDIKMHAGDYTLQLITLEDLEEFAKWPRFRTKDLAWANFPATTSQLRQRWYKSNIKSHVIWLCVRNLTVDANTCIARVSISQTKSNKDELIFGIVLHPDYLSQGIGTIITKITLNVIFQRSQIKSVWLESATTNERAHQTWKSVGFTHTGTHYRMNTFRRYEEFLGYRYYREKSDSLPKVEFTSIEEQ